MSDNDGLKDWLIHSMDRRVIHYNPYQYGYVFTIDGRKVIMSANGYAAHYAWGIPDISKEIIYEQPDIQIIDFGFGQNLDAAKEWKTVIPAFTNLLKRFSECDAIRVDTASVMEAVNHFERSSEHGFEEDGESLQVRCSEDRLHLNCSGSSTEFDFPLQNAVQNQELTVTINGRFLKNALSGFEGYDTIVCRFLMKPDLISIGVEGDKVAIIMGIQTLAKE